MIFKGGMDMGRKRIVMGALLLGLSLTLTGCGGGIVLQRWIR